MNLRSKDFLTALLLTAGITFLMQYFFPYKEVKVQNSTEQSLESGRFREAPQSVEVHRPINLEIDFLDDEPKTEYQESLVETKFAKYFFTTEGASIDRIEFKHPINGKEMWLETIDSQRKEDKCLFVAFEEKTPFYYKLDSRQDNDEFTILTYSSKFAGGTVIKKFIVFKDICKVDLEVSVEPKDNSLDKPVRLRIFYPSPILQGLTDDTYNALFNKPGSSNEIVKRSADKIGNGYWEIPSFFGAEDRYFVNAMINDTNGFAKRGFYSTCGNKLVFSILEGPAVKEKSTWNLSFFFGPKRISVMESVDKRLDQTIDYGYIPFLSKILLRLLNYIYSFVHNYGWAIVILTILIKLVLLPFTAKGETETKKSSSELQKKLQYIQQKYKDDKEALARAKAEVIRKHGMPGASGCLTLLLQLPIFISLNRILSSSVALYKAPFLWIPNLSMPDPLYILPALVGISMIFHSSALKTDPRQQFFSYFMALLLAIFTANLPAGLTLYIFVSTALSVLQTKAFNAWKRA